MTQRNSHYVQLLRFCYAGCFQLLTPRIARSGSHRSMHIMFISIKKIHVPIVRDIRRYLVLSLTVFALALSGCDTVNESAEPLEGAAKASLAISPDVKKPGRPIIVSNDKVNEEVEEILSQGDLTVDDLEMYVNSFESAQTSNGLNYLLTGALAIKEHVLDDKESESYDKLIAESYNEAVQDIRVSAPMLGYEGPGECDVDFDSQSVLDSLPFDAANGISYPPHWLQPCGGSAVVVEPTRYNHYHLSFEDPDIGCLDANTGLVGRLEADGATCTPLADPTIEPRLVYSHSGDEVIRVRLTWNGFDAPFTLHNFTNRSSVPVKVRYKLNPAGPWYTWQSMAGNTVWNTGDYTVDVYEVQFTNADANTSCGLDWVTTDPFCQYASAPFAIDDLSISP